MPKDQEKEDKERDTKTDKNGKWVRDPQSSGDVVGYILEEPSQSFKNELDDLQATHLQIMDDLKREEKIQKKIREMAIESLTKEGEL